MDVTLDVDAVPMTEEQINAILSSREPREEIVIEKKELTLAMIAAEPPLSDPQFKEGDVVPCTYDAGAQLNCLDAHDAEFKEKIQEMFNAGPQLKLTKEGIDEQLEQYQEVNLPMVENE
jgi:hypothetical protein